MKTRDRILETALRLFNEEGAAKVPTNRIATELEMSPGNLYYHFRQKEQLVDRLLRRLTNRGIETVERLCHQLAAAGALRANDGDIRVLALQMMMAATCWFTFARMLPEN